MRTTKLFYALAASALLGLTACSSDEPVAQNGDGNVNFTLRLPDAIGTRAFSDGLSATQLDYYVYDEDNGSTNIEALNGTATFVNRETTVSLNLVSGKSYSIVFLATVPGQSHYTYTASSKDLNVTYGSAAQDENRDAFYVYEPTFKVTGAISKDIILRRPFAQINVGTTDWASATAAGISLTETSMTVTGVANKINLGTGDVEGNEEVTFTSAAMPATPGETFPYAAANVDRYMAMNYVLVGKDKSTVDVKMNTNANPAIDEMVFSQVPVQRNHRTNIYGSLLTNPAAWNVIIDEKYDDFDINIDLNDEQIHEGVYANEEAKSYKITSAEGFKWFAENRTLKAGETFYLLNDIDFCGEVVTPIQVAFAAENKITIDGQGNTLKNLRLEGANGAIFSGTMVGELKNLNVEGVTGEISNRFSGIIANLYGNVSNVHVKNYNVRSTEGRIGAIVGIHNSGNMTDCSVEDVTINGGWSVGGVSGAINETNNRVYKNVTVKNVTISGNASIWGEDYAAYKGTIVGDIYVTGVVFENCSIEGTVQGLSKPGLPIDTPDLGYTWNGTSIQ